MLVKVEGTDESQLIDTNVSTSQNQCENPNNRVLDEIVSVRAKYNETFFELEKLKKSSTQMRSEKCELEHRCKQKETLIASLELDKKQSSENVMKLEEKINSLELELLSMKNALKIAKKDNILLRQQVNSSDETYEVEKLLSHKYENNERFFLVRWNGYDKSHDSWERESNLNCDEILQKYLKRKRLN